MSDPERLLFLTGKMALAPLTRLLESMDLPQYTWQIHQIGVSVAALMTADLIARRLTNVQGADRVIVPGRCRGDLQRLSQTLGVPVQRGPDELKDLPRFFGRELKPVDLSEHDIRIFAEIVDAPELTIEQILQRAAALRADGADVIDLGCLPQTRFNHLAPAVRELKTQGYQVSVDSMDPRELICGSAAGADYLLSLTEESIGLLNEVSATPVLIPAQPGDLDSLRRATDKAREIGRDFLADPILDPIHFGFTESIVRYRQLRVSEPDMQIMMGTGNVTELTHVDTAGVTMTLLGVMSELRLNALLTTQVSRHARRAVSEADHARRVLFAARTNGELPKNISDALMMLHERDPFPDSAAEIRELAGQVRDPNYRIQVTSDGIYLYNRDGMQCAQSAFDFWPALQSNVEADHAFYLGAELGRAQIALQLGKRYTQDESLDWGVAVDMPEQDLSAHKLTGTTRKKRKSDS